MQEAARVIKMLMNARGKNDKQLILQQNACVPGLKDILRFIYNPYLKTGISKAKLKKAKMYNSGGEHITWQEAIDYFSRNQTGSDIDLMYASTFIKSSKDESWLAEAIVTQDLKIGVNATSLNNAYGKDFIPKTGCMLGTLYANVKDPSFPCIVTEKLDGVRRVLVKEGGCCRMYSRSGHEDTGLVEILKEAEYLPDNTVYDGELLAEGTFKDSIAHRQATNSIANMKGNKTGLIFNIFDMLPVSDFYKGKCPIPAIDRKKLLAATFKEPGLSLIEPNFIALSTAFGIEQELQHITAVPILGSVRNLNEASPIVEKIWSRGGEGIMLNSVNAPYEIKRSKYLMKIKHTEELVLPVVDVIEGTGKYEGMMGALVVEYKGSLVGVGTGFTDFDRAFMYEHRGALIGKLAEIETFGESTNAQGYVSLNCPVFKRLVGEE